MVYHVHNHGEQFDSEKPFNNKVAWPNGKASDYESEDSGFDPQHDHLFASVDKPQPMSVNLLTLEILLCIISLVDCLIRLECPSFKQLRVVSFGTGDQFPIIHFGN